MDGETLDVVDEVLVIYELRANGDEVSRRIEPNLCHVVEEDVDASIVVDSYCHVERSVGPCWFMDVFAWVIKIWFCENHHLIVD